MSTQWRCFLSGFYAGGAFLVHSAGMVNQNNANTLAITTVLSSTLLGLAVYQALKAIIQKQ